MCVAGLGAARRVRRGADGIGLGGVGKGRVVRGGKGWAGQGEARRGQEQINLDKWIQTLER